MVAANPLWRAPRIHGELMLGSGISERTLSRILRSLGRPPGQTRMTYYWRSTAGYRVMKRSALGGLHHEYRLVKEAA